MSSQVDLFGAPVSEPKAKAKVLPKVEARAVAPLTSQFQPLPPRKRTKPRLGTMRLSERSCRACGGEQLEVLDEVHAEAGQRWSVYCLNKRCERCPDHGLAEVTR